MGTNYPQYLAQSIAYTPWGAVSQLTNGAPGGGTGAQETYQYNNRLEVSQVQLATSNSGAGYTLGYNYSLPGGSTPPGCPVQAQGSGNNGSVIGYTYTGLREHVLQPLGALRVRRREPSGVCPGHRLRGRII